MIPLHAASHGGNPWVLLESPAGDPSAVLDFSADLNPLGPPPALGQLLQEAASRVPWYPEPTYREFREAAARAEGVDPAQILPGNGTADLIRLISRWRAGCTVLVMTPTFTEYERAAAADRSAVVPWPADEEAGFVHSTRYPVPIGGARINPGTEKWGRYSSQMEGGLLFVCNPNNPTGVLWRREQLLELIALAGRRDAVVVLDEAYMDFVEDGRRYSLASLTERNPALLVLRSLTKSFCIPGLRAGYLVGSPDRVRRLQSVRPPWAMNAMAAFVSARLLEQEQEAWLDSTRRQVGLWRSSLEQDLRVLDWIRPYPAAANFLLCRLLDPAKPGPWLAERLAKRGILIRTCDDFTGLEPGRFIRLAVRSAEENRRLVEALQDG